MTSELDELHSTPVRVLPVHPLGGRPAVDATQLVEVGAMAGAFGVERGDVVALLHRLQVMNMQSSLAALPEVMELIKKANVDRLNTLVQKVRGMAEYGGGIGRIFNGQANVSLVSRQEVINLLTAAMVENPPIR